MTDFDRIFLNTLNPAPDAKEPKTVDEYFYDFWSSEELHRLFKQYGDCDLSEVKDAYEKRCRELAREKRDKIKREWDAQADSRRCHELHESQPSPRAFSSTLRRDLEKHSQRPDLLDAFCSWAQDLYAKAPFRYPDTRPVDYMERMTTKGPRLIHDAMVRCFHVYTSRKPNKQQLITDILDDPNYADHFLFMTLAVEKLPITEDPDMTVDPELAFSGTWIVSPQGRGKTTLLRKLILDRMNEPCSIIIFDSKGDLSEPFRSHRFPKDVVVLDPHPQLALNALDLGTHSIGTLMHVYSMLLDAGVTPLQSVLLRHTVYLATHIPNATITTIRDILLKGAQNYAAYVEKIEDEEEQSFWTTDFPTSTYTKTRQELLWRIELLRPPGSVIRSIFAAPQTRVKLAPLMDGNTITIINNSRALLDPLQSEFFARLFLVMILGAAEQRALRTEKYPCYVFIDEADTVISTATELADIIYRCRSQRIAMLCAHQSLSQIENKQVQSALGDCAIKYANSDDDAHALAPKLRTTAEQLQSLQVGEFAVSLRGQPTQIARIPLPDFSPYPLLSQAQIEARDLEMARRYHYTPEKKPLVIPPAPPITDTPTWGDKPVV